jgi:hypothetical protein
MYHPELISFISMWLQVAWRQGEALACALRDDGAPPPPGTLRVRYIGYQQASRFATGTKLAEFDVGGAPGAESVLHHLRR